MVNAVLACTKLKRNLRKRALWETQFAAKIVPVGKRPIPQTVGNCSTLVALHVRYKVRMVKGDRVHAEIDEPFRETPMPGLRITLEFEITMYYHNHTRVGSAIKKAGHLRHNIFGNKTIHTRAFPMGDFATDDVPTKADHDVIHIVGTYMTCAGCFYRGTERVNEFGTMPRRI